MLHSLMLIHEKCEVFLMMSGQTLVEMQGKKLSIQIIFGLLRLGPAAFSEMFDTMVVLVLLCAGQPGSSLYKKMFW